MKEWLNHIWLKIKTLLRRKRLDRELEEELAFHLTKSAEKNRDFGLDAEEARYAARRQLGNVTSLKEKSRAMWTFSWPETLWQDVRFGVRMLKKNPGFTVVAVLTLALGIGANTAIFTVVNAVLLRPLPYPDSDRLVYLSLRDAKGGFDRSGYGFADFLAASKQQKSLEHLAGLSTAGGLFTLTGGATPEAIPGVSVTAEFFEVLGVKPFLGRTFLPSEGQPENKKVVVVSHAFWERHLQSDQQPVGRTVTLDGQPYVVIGVMPRDFHFGPKDNDGVWPILQLQAINQRPPYFLLTLARLKPEMSASQAQADLSAIASRVREQFPNSPYDGVVIRPLKTLLVGDARLPLLVLLGAVGLVLLIAMVNVANLQMARAVSRGREMAIRRAIGAGRGRLLRQLLVESVLLAGIGGALGLLLAGWSVKLLLAVDPDWLPRTKEIVVDGRVMAFTAIIALSAGILFGLAPAAQGLRTQASDALRECGRGLSEHAGRLGFRRALIVMEFSLALVLLVGAGLLIRSFSRLTATSPGFRPEHILTAHLILPEVRYGQETQITSFHDRLLKLLRDTPGVQEAAVTMSVPPNKLQIENPFRLPSEPIVPGATTHFAEEMTVSPGYFQTLGVPLLQGRFFDDSDRNRKDGILIVNKALVDQFFPRENPIGQKIQTGDPNPDNPWETVVGVVGDVKYQGLDAKPHATLYVPYFEAGWTSWSRDIYVILRSPMDPKQLTPELRQAIWSLDRDLPVEEVQTMDELLVSSVAGNRFRTLLLEVFAGLALLLAAVGIYGVISYSVSQRTQEMGIRVALGAEPADLVKLVVGQGLRMAIFGVALGIGGGLLITRLFASMLFEVGATDPVTFVTAAGVLTFIALAACYLPARRATRVDPMVALRYE
jgi:predicted permease